MKKYNCLKIRTISIEEYIQKRKPDFNYSLDYFYFLLSIIIEKSTYLLKDKQESLWVPLSSNIMRNHPYDYREHLRYLSNKGAILVRKPYSSGRCFSYRLAFSLQYEPVDIYNITDRKLNRYISRMGSKNDKLPNKFKKKYMFLKKYFNSDELKIDVSSAMNENLKTFDESNLPEDKKVIKQRNDVIQLCSFLNGDFNISYNPRTDGRVHTLLTRTSKSLRKFIRYNDKTLSEVDISSSVPLFLYHLMKGLKEMDKKSDSLTIDDLKNHTINNQVDHLIDLIDNVTSDNDELISDNQKSSNNNHMSSLIHYMSEKSTELPDDEEIESFGSKVKNGTFYEVFEDDVHTIHHFSKANKKQDFREAINKGDFTRPLKKDEYLMENVKKLYGREFDGDQEDIRGVIKKNMLSMLNAKPGHYINEEAMFNMHFPGILRWLKEFKKEDHRLFSHLMLQIESNYMLNVVARKFNKKYNGKKPLFTLHDCLITTVDNLDTLYHFMFRELSKHLKLKPNLKKVIWE